MDGERFSSNIIHIFIKKNLHMTYTWRNTNSVEQTGADVLRSRWLTHCFWNIRGSEKKHRSSVMRRRVNLALLGSRDRDSRIAIRNLVFWSTLMSGTKHQTAWKLVDCGGLNCTYGLNLWNHWLIAVKYYYYVARRKKRKTITFTFSVNVIPKILATLGNGQVM